MRQRAGPAGAAPQRTGTGLSASGRRRSGGSRRRARHGRPPPAQVGPAPPPLPSPRAAACARGAAPRREGLPPPVVSNGCGCRAPRPLRSRAGRPPVPAAGTVSNGAGRSPARPAEERRWPAARPSVLPEQRLWAPAGPRPGEEPRWAPAASVPGTPAWAYPATGGGDPFPAGSPRLRAVMEERGRSGGAVAEAPGSASAVAEGERGREGGWRPAGASGPGLGSGKRGTANSLSAAEGLGMCCYLPEGGQAP